MAFVHLHVHTQYSILDGMSNIEKLFTRAEELEMPGIAITDHGNMYGVKEFCNIAAKHPSVKPVIGCEVYVTKHYDHKLKDKDHKGYYHLILLAKNYEGYKNLMKIVSTGHIEGQYYGKPRVSHEIIEKYHENLICSSACMAGEIPRKILEGDEKGLEESIAWFKRVFGEDYYFEVMLHKTEVPGLSLNVYEGEKKYSEEIFRLAQKHNVKVILTNDVHFINKEDGPAHDLLICLNTGKTLDDQNRLHYTQQEYLKSEAEMALLYPEHPEILSNTLEILDKVETYKIDRDHVLPKFEIDPAFVEKKEEYLEKYKEVIDKGRNDEKGSYRGDEFCLSVAYLCYLTYIGAEGRYGELNPDLAERIDFELKTISGMGFPDYFLIVQDFINWARRNGISVGPGRGSAAGSVVSYCLGITNLDPVKYNLLFERFLNPERISMPDIDVDFDDEGRYRVIQYVQERYGEDHISHVITFGTMAAKLAIKDVARVCGLAIPEANRLTKLIPERPFEVPGKDKPLKPTLNNCIKFVDEVKKEYEDGEPLVKQVLRFACQLEGCIRQIGIHACAMIIGRGNLTDYIPVTTGQDKATGQEVWVSQYEGSMIEDVGMLKMDFLGLRTLSIIKECLALVKKNYGHDIDIEKIPIDDAPTYELFSRGDTKSVFQFESTGMKEWLMRLHPQRFEDLIAMVALYRPGPMQYIPNFVARKQGEEKIEYDLPEMEAYLKETYGVTVYQEQVMQISQKISGFSKGKADKLRKAMGKKKLDVLEGLYKEFLEGGLQNGHPREVLDKIWKDWRAFAEYAFNKSHATCYAWVSYQTAWLKAHYPSEFQAANLSQNLNKMDELKEIMDDCKKNRINVLSPDINESDSHFAVNKKGDIRFGLGGMKGFGSNIVDAILKERGENGPFSDVFDLMERMAGTVNSRALECLIYSGALDSLGIKRSQYFIPCANGNQFISEIIRYADLYRNDTLDSSCSLFGDSEEMKPKRPEVPASAEEENKLLFLEKEKEYVGMYISNHPLQQYDYEIKHFTNCALTELDSEEDECFGLQQPKKISIAGIITDVSKILTKKGLPGLKILLEDYSGSKDLALFGKDTETFASMAEKGNQVLIQGEIKPRYKAKAEPGKPVEKVPYEFKISTINHLGNVSEEKTVSVTLHSSTDSINPKLRKDLVKILKENKGKTTLFFALHDKESGYNVELHCKKYSVKVSAEFLREIEALGIYTSIVKKNIA